MLRHPVVFDGRNLFDPAWVVGHGLEYYAIGRAAVEPDSIPEITTLALADDARQLSPAL